MLPDTAVPNDYGLLDLMDPIDFERQLARIEFDDKVFEKAVHTQQSRNREIFHEPRLNMNWSPGDKERDFVHVGLCRTLDSNRLLRPPGLYVEADVPPDLCMKHATCRARIDDRFKAPRSGGILHRERNTYIESGGIYIRPELAGKYFIGKSHRQS